MILPCYVSDYDYSLKFTGLLINLLIKENIFLNDEKYFDYNNYKKITVLFIKTFFKIFIPEKEYGIEFVFK